MKMFHGVVFSTVDDIMANGDVSIQLGNNTSHIHGLTLRSFKQLRHLQKYNIS
jgi:ribosome biogenesis protein Nip4